ncbi:hypothetical protein E1293_23195 [Actinomadura darangshiensis]|uniref:Lipoprotein n=1 Tax=Actinomadura darangshiensis TaxID=705336 RepID=A0A4R5B2W0_9ACTN|nr:hypothetical protein [Actinomadura darangshiensis]TDD79505.1 hypothetical protein E1293_23195 [Actinomadura darangshiensis]
MERIEGLVNRKTVLCLAMVPGLVLTGCSGKSSDQGGQQGASRTATPSPSGSSAATTSSLDASCQTVSTVANSQLFAAALAVAGRNKEKTEIGADVAKTYRDFARQLILLAPQAPVNLQPALTEWASASTAVARFVAKNKPGPGVVVDLGPPDKRWKAAKKAAEKVCGRELPELDD